MADLFSFTCQNNDVAILTLSSPVPYDATISPVCLPPQGSSNQYVSREAAIIGWGTVKEGTHSERVPSRVSVSPASHASVVSARFRWISAVRPTTIDRQNHSQREMQIKLPGH